MKQLFAKDKTKLKVFLGITLGNLIVLLYCVCFLNPVSSSNDDFFLGIIAGNGFGTNTSFLVYVSTFYGYFLQFWYKLFPDINWYVIFSYLFLLFSISIIEYILTIKYKFWGMIVSILFSVGFSHYFYVVFQYTKVSSLLTLAGFFILFYWLDITADSKKVKFAKYFLGTVFLFLGSLIRLQSFFMVCVFGFGIWTVKLMDSLLKKETKNFLCYFVCPFIGIFVFILSFSVFEEKVWDVSTQELSYFQKYNEVRTMLVDYNIPDYNSHQLQYEALGLSQNDLDNLTRWCFADQDKFSLEVLQQIAAMNDKNNFSFKETLKYIRNNVITHEVFKLCGILTLTCLFLAKKKQYGKLLAPHLCFFLVLFYLNYIGRITEWVMNSLWLVYLLTIITVFCIHFTDFSFSKKICYKLCGCCLCGTILFNSNILLTRALTPQPVHGNLYQCINAISNSKELNFFCDVTSIYDVSREYLIYEKTPENFFSNIFFSGGWFSCSPQENYTKTHAEIENIYRDILYKEDYVVLDREAIESKQFYLNENYSPTARYSKIQDLYDYPVFKFSDNYTGKRTKSNLTSTLEITSSEDGYYAITGMIHTDPDLLTNSTLYLEITDNNGDQTTYSGRFEQMNPYGLYSIRYNSYLSPTREISFFLPASAPLSSQYQYKVLLCYGEEAQEVSINWK